MTTANTVALSLGSNLGDRLSTLRRAIDLIGALEGVQLAGVSSFYSTEPVGVTDQPEFINCAVVVTTTLPAGRLLAELRAIESTLGRQARTRWHEREIDIDILLFGDKVVDSEELTIPHPEMAARGFVLHPLAEIAPAMIHPLAGLAISEMLALCPDTAAVVPIERGSDE